MPEGIKNIETMIYSRESTRQSGIREAKRGSNRERERERRMREGEIFTYIFTATVLSDCGSLCNRLIHSLDHDPVA